MTANDVPPCPRFPDFPKRVLPDATVEPPTLTKAVALLEEKQAAEPKEMAEAKWVRAIPENSSDGLVGE